MSPDDEISFRKAQVVFRSPAHTSFVAARPCLNASPPSFCQQAESIAPIDPAPCKKVNVVGMHACAGAFPFVWVGGRLAPRRNLLLPAARSLRAPLRQQAEGRALQVACFLRPRQKKLPSRVTLGGFYHLSRWPASRNTDFLPIIAKKKPKIPSYSVVEEV